MPLGSGEVFVIVGAPPPAQGLWSEALLRGLGAPTVKSLLLLSVSVQPLLFLMAAVVFESTAVEVVS